MFDFDSITLGSDQILVGPPSVIDDAAPPLALLSRGDVTIDGKIDVSASTLYTLAFFPRWPRRLR